LLHSPVILFDGVVQVLAGPHSYSFRQLAISFEICDCPVGCGIGIQHDLGRNPLFRQPSVHYREPLLLARNKRGKFEDISRQGG